VMDMLGNIWEWCLNKDDGPEDTAIDKSGDSRALRGGSWYDGPGSARAALRYGLLPDGRSGGRGFRVVCVSPIDR
jgi:formylglycine-generating enzyme required for sulfatase activity